MAKYDYIKIRVNDEERAMLQNMVADGKASTLSDAARKLVFAPKASSSPISSLTQYLQELAEAHQEIRKLIYAQLENKALYEPDLIRMERELATMSKNAAKLMREIRKEL